MFNNERVYIIFDIKDCMIKYNDLSFPLKLAVTWSLVQMSMTVVILLGSLVSILGYAL